MAPTWTSSQLRYRHVAKTDDIKDVVITEESSTAKGIRRIVAVTGHEAQDVSRKAIEFERKLERIEGMQGKEKELAMKPYLMVNPITENDCRETDDSCIS